MSLDYRPDTPFGPNIFQSLTFVMPDKAGNYRTPYSATNPGWPNAHTSIATAVKGSRMVQFTDGTPNWFVGTATKIYELNGGALVFDVTLGGGGGAYTSGTAWWFCQFGDSTIACNYANATQVRTSSVAATAFANLSGAPKARFFLSQSGYLLACNYDDGTASPSGIKWATEGSTTTWTAATGNTAGNAVLRQTPGQIVAGAEIHDIVAIWKKNSMYVGRVIGGSGTSVWQFNLLSPKIGCASQEAWAATPVGIIFVSPNNGIYRFDGSVPVPIDRGIRQTFYRNVGTAANIRVTHDESSQSVFIWTSSLCWAYNYACDKWGVAYQSSTLGNASYTTMTCNVRDANYDDFITLGGTTDANRRCHLIFTSEKDPCNLSALSAGSGINATMAILSVRDPKADADDLTKLTRVTGIFVFDSEDGFYTGEPASGTMSDNPRGTIGGGSFGTTATAGYSSAHTRWDLDVTANTHALSWAFTAQKFILSDLLFDTQINGQA